MPWTRSTFVFIGMTIPLLPAWCLAGLLLGAGLLQAAQAAQAADVPPPVSGFLVRLRDAPAHAGPAQQGLMSVQRASDEAALAAHWSAVLTGTGVAAESGWRLEPMGKASHLLRPPRPLSVAEASRWTARLAARPEVAWVLPDEREPRLQAEGTVPADPLFAGITQQWWLQAASGSNAQPLAARLRGVPGFQTAWARGTGSANVVVAVLDTGITAHPDIPADRLLPGFDMVSDWDASTGRGYANDGGGRDADPTDPGDWVDASDQAADPARFGGCAVSASTWHGTAVAGMIAAAANNGVGGAGVAWAGRILPVRVAGKCGASVRDIIDGMRWAAGLSVCQTWRSTLDPSSGCAAWAPINPTPARIINISFGGAAACHAEYQAAVDELWARGVVVVAAAGNDHAAPARPASCNRVLGVAALNRDGFKANYSNFGAALRIATIGGDDAAGQWGGLLADGGLLSLAQSGAAAVSTPGYDRHVGTSFATPLVSGAISLMLSAAPGLSADEIVNGLQASARPHVGSPWIGACSANNPGRCLCTTSTCGAGILDADQAVAYAQAVGAGQSYQAPAWPAVLLDTLELAQAAALGPDREAPAATTPETGSTESGQGGGAMGWGSLVLLLLATLALAWRRRHPVPRPCLLRSTDRQPRRHR